MQQPITGTMAPSIIHALKAVQIHEQQRTGTARLLVPNDCFFELSDHGLVIGEASNDVGDGQIHELLVEQVSLVQEQLLSHSSRIVRRPRQLLPLGVAQGLSPVCRWSLFRCCLSLFNSLGTEITHTFQTLQKGKSFHDDIMARQSHSYAKSG